VNGREPLSRSAKILTFFVKLYDCLAVFNPTMANAYAVAWDYNDKYFFRKLKLYALSKSDVFTATDVV
jgi:hypothetical protein